MTMARAVAILVRTGLWLRTAAILIAVLPMAGAAAPVAYRLGAGDTLQVSVFGEPDLGGKFTIGADGAIGYPRLGRVTLQGMSAEEAAGRLMAGLAGRIPAGHTVSVDVIGHAPVFVTGDVQSPGRYEFRPDMIVLELVALGGGVRRPPTLNSNAALQLLTLRQELADQKLFRWAQRVELARLQAEMADRAFDADGLIQSGAPVSLVAAEGAVLGRRREGLAGQIAALVAQGKALDEEITSLEASLRLHDEELALIAQDVAATRQLADQGLTAQSRLRESQRQQSGLKRDKLEVQSFLARARHNRIDIDQRMSALRAVRAAEDALALRALELAIVRTDQKLASLAASIGAASEELEASDLRQLPATSFTIVRRTPSGTQQFPVHEHARLQPGDILEVDRKLDAIPPPQAR
ncbi:polysaccharide biosynthesis/export family protein [Kaistia adipata]|uniref:polysaccharide biosynthesis/export family protein n=1 Tax=Kaistia adipata TaxID=166954 RepID=UPI0003F84502|nr:polysaccharide biosynthesis/export family protein [Kaistia adipata]